MGNRHTASLEVGNMTCAGCEIRIETKLKNTQGVSLAKADYAKGVVDIEFDFTILNMVDIVKIIEALGYNVQQKNNCNETEGSKPILNKRKDLLVSFAIFISIAAFIGVIAFIATSINNDFNPLRLSADAGLIAVFLFGLVTSLHCVFMCGGIQFSVCTSYKTDISDGGGKLTKLKPSMLYSLGRVISYTFIGGALGSIGSAVAMTRETRSVFEVIIGILMIIMGIAMLNHFPLLRKFAPRMPKFIGHKLHSRIGKSGPFVVGILTGFRPCGPLQTAQIYALGTASMMLGALTMLLFSLSTIPIMLGFGLASSSLSEKLTGKMTVIGAAIVIFMGLGLLVRGIL